VLRRLGRKPVTPDKERTPGTEQYFSSEIFSLDAIEEIRAVSVLATESGILEMVKTSTASHASNRSTFRTMRAQVRVISVVIL